MKKDLFLRFLCLILGYLTLIFIIVTVYLAVHSFLGWQLGHTSLAYYLIPLEWLELLDPRIIIAILLTDWRWDPLSRIILILLWLTISILTYKIIQKIRRRS